VVGVGAVAESIATTETEVAPVGNEAAGILIVVAA